MSNHSRVTVAFALCLGSTTLLAGLVCSPTGFAAQNQRRPARGSRQVAQPWSPSSHQAALQRFGDCSELREYATDAIVEMLLEMRYGWFSMLEDDSYSHEEPPAPTTSSPTDYTTTNNQEEDVDELDIVKSDGSYLYSVVSGELTITQAWPAAQAALISRLRLPGSPRGLFLQQDTVAVLSSGSPWLCTYADSFAPCWQPTTRIDIIDVTQRHMPVILRSIKIEGYLVTARLIDGQLYTVLASDLDVPDEIWNLAWAEDMPEIPWDYTPEQREIALDYARMLLTPRVADQVALLELANLVPALVDDVVATGERTTRPLLGCGDLARPAVGSAYSILAITHLDLRGSAAITAEVHASGAIASGWDVYASQHNLYVAESSRWWWGWWHDPLDLTTVIHKFELTGEVETPVVYAATGEVPGWLLSQFSMGEHDGYLRVATTELDRWWFWMDDETQEEPGNLVSVLADNNHGELEVVGQLDGIAPGEQIYAARFIGDKGYLVTFVQVDPLFTLDLSDPTDPRIVGELKLPGYSAYLHPMGEDYLLTVGMDGNENGTINGLAVSVFDVSDFAHPTLAHQYTIEADPDLWSSSEALGDHHAFTFHRGVLSMPVDIYGWLDRSGWQWLNGLLVLEIDPLAGITQLGFVDHESMASPAGSGRRSSQPIRRSMYVEDFLYSLSELGIKVNELLHPEVEVTTVLFPPSTD